MLLLIATIHCTNTVDMLFTSFVAGTEHHVLPMLSAETVCMIAGLC